MHSPRYFGKGALKPKQLGGQKVGVAKATRPFVVSPFVQSYLQLLGFPCAAAICPQQKGRDGVACFVYAQDAVPNGASGDGSDGACRITQLLYDAVERLNRLR